MTTQKVKYLAREYPHGEVILLFPEMAAAPGGEWAVAYSGGAEFYPVDPEKVVHNTTPASANKGKMLLHQLKKLDLPFEYEKQTGRLAPVKARKLREDDEIGFRSFPRLKQDYK